MNMSLYTRQDYRPTSNNEYQVLIIQLIINHHLNKQENDNIHTNYSDERWTCKIQENVSRQSRNELVYNDNYINEMR